MDLHLCHFQISLAHLLSLFSQNRLKLALFLLDFLLELSIKLFPKLGQLCPLLLRKLGSQSSLHLCVDVMCSLSVVHNLLLLHAKAL